MIRSISETSSEHSNFLQKIVNFLTSALLVICFVFGGTSQAIIQPKIGLYCGAVLIIAWVLWHVQIGEVFSRSKSLVFIFGGFILFSLIQLVPLPPFIWTALPGHSVIAEGFQALEITLPWLPISMAPEKTLSSLFDFLPPIAIFLFVKHFASTIEKKIAIWILAIFSVFSVILGLLQVNMTDGALYFYAVTNPDLPVGFFSNSNHQASFLLMSLALSFTLFAGLFSGRQSRSKRQTGPVILFATMLLLGIILGLVLNTSVAGYLLMPLVVVLSVALVLFTKRVEITKIHIISFVTIIPLVSFVVWDLFFASSTMQGLMQNLSSHGDMSRVQMFAKTIEIIPDYFPFGSGLGSYREVFRLYEDKNIITNVFSPHTHNDYLELVLEYGFVGVIAITTFLFFYGRKFIVLVRGRRRYGVIGVAASIAILAVLLHSLVDYPMRTIAISTLFAFCLSLQDNNRSARK